MSSKSLISTILYPIPKILRRNTLADIYHKTNYKNISLLYYIIILLYIIIILISKIIAITNIYNKKPI